MREARHAHTPRGITAAPHRGYHVTTGEVRRMRELRQQGHTLAQVAASTGRAERTIWDYTREVAVCG